MPPKAADQTDDPLSPAAPQVAAAEPVDAVPPVAAQPVQKVDADYSAVLGAVVHELAKLYDIKDDAKVVITSDKVSAANFTATLEVNVGKLTITLTPVVNSAGAAALEAIKLKLEAPKPVEVEPVEAAVEAAVEPVKPVDAAVEPVKPVEAAVEPVKPVDAGPGAVQADAAGEVATSAGGYRRRKRNLRTIKKQQQRKRRTMYKH